MLHRLAMCLVLPVVGCALVFAAAPRAFAHGAGFKDPSDSPKRSARPSPLEPAPPVVTPDAGQGVQPSWRPEGWYRWWELNAIGYVPLPARALAEAAPAVTTGKDGPVPAVAAPAAWRARYQRLLLDVLRSETKVPLRVRATALACLGRIGHGPAPAALLQSWAANKKVQHELREAALLGLALLRRTKPSEQLPVETLESVRRTLLDRIDDSSERIRTRAFAIHALGMLADQPHPDTPLARDGRHTTRALWQRLVHLIASSELSIAMLSTIGLQPRAGVPEGVLVGLRGIVLGERVRNRTWGAFERSHALAALVRLQAGGIDQLLLRLAGDGRQHHAVRAATAIGLMQRAEQLATPARLGAFRALRASCDALGTAWLVRALSQMAMGALLGADLRQDSEAILASARQAVSWLQDQALSGPREGRPFCALALGLASYERRVASLRVEDFHTRSERILRQQLLQGARSDRMLGAFAIALGMTKADFAQELLLTHVKERGRHPMLRAHCALALGMIGERDLEVGTVLIAASRERARVFLHMEAARALGMLGVPGASEKLLRRFRAEIKASVSAALALGLAAHGQTSACPALLERLAKPGEEVGVRVSCMVALAALLEPDVGGSSGRMTRHANYPALPGGMRRFLDSL